MSAVVLRFPTGERIEPRPEKRIDKCAHCGREIDPRDPCAWDAANGHVLLYCTARCLSDRIRAEHEAKRASKQEWEEFLNNLDGEP